jgi:hypothetical protein
MVSLRRPIGRVRSGLAHDDLGVGGGGGEMVEKDEAVRWWDPARR